MPNQIQNLYKRNVKGFLTLLIILAFVAVFVHSSFLYGILILIGIYSIVTIGLSLLMGYAGQVSLGHAAFFGIGAYASGILSTTYQMPPFVALLIGVMITALIAFIVGIPTLKLEGFALALATIGFNVIVYTIILALTEFTGGASGLRGIPNLSLFGLTISADVFNFLIVWGIVLLVAFFSINIINSHVGRILRGIHDSEIATETLGVYISKYKVQIFVLSAIFASIAGSLYAHFMRFIAPPTFSVNASILFLVMVAVGGAQSIWGAILGAAIMTLLSEGVSHFVPMIMEGGGQAVVIVYGLALILVMMFIPKGLIFSISNGWEKMSGKVKSSNTSIPVKEKGYQSEK